MTLGLLPHRAQAGYFEISGNGAFSKYNNGIVGNVNSYTKTVRWGGGVAYRFLSNTALELSYMNSSTTDRYGQQDTSILRDYDITKITQIQNTSLNLILDFADRKARFRPYVSAGGGVMTRITTIKGTATQQPEGLSAPLTEYRQRYYSASTDFGIGLKIFVVEAVAIDASFNLYATDLDKSEIYLHYSGAAGLRFIF